MVVVQHHCIYCDSRSQCYGIEDFDGEVLVKANGLELLRRELARKRVKGYISTGSMNDAYQPLERKLGMTRGALEIIAKQRFPVHMLTKSDLILRDIDLLAAIDERAAGARPGAGVSFTITTTDDDLARKLEPGAPPPSQRLAALAAVAARGIRTGVMLMPVLPFLEDSVENIRAVVSRAHEHGYERAFGEGYHAPAQNSHQLEATFEELRQRLGMQRYVAPYQAANAHQLSLF